MIAPAMNTNMFEHPAVAKNLQALVERGVLVVEPGSGYLACGWIGKGRLAEPEDVVASVEQFLKSKTSSASLTGRKLLITAGPTFEDIDPVRFVGNRSSGRMGYAVAAEASRRGATVTLVSGPTHLTVPQGVSVIKVRSAAEMHRAVMDRVEGQDVVVMSAAVADYTVSEPAKDKMKKSDGPMTITLSRTKDILGDLGKLPSRKNGTPILVGFAAETTDVVNYAKSKLQQKGADLIVANDVSRADAGFDVDTNAVTLVTASSADDVPLQAKSAVAAKILDRIEQFLIAAPVRTLQ